MKHICPNIVYNHFFNNTYSHFQLNCTNAWVIFRGFLYCCTDIKPEYSIIKTQERKTPRDILSPDHHVIDFILYYNYKYITVLTKMTNF